MHIVITCHFHLSDWQGLLRLIISDIVQGKGNLITWGGGLITTNKILWGDIACSYQHPEYVSISRNFFISICTDAQWMSVVFFNH